MPVFRSRRQGRRTYAPNLKVLPFRLRRTYVPTEKRTPLKCVLPTQLTKRGPAEILLIKANLSF